MANEFYKKFNLENKLELQIYLLFADIWDEEYWERHYYQKL